MNTEHGLARPDMARGACGVGALVDLNGTKTHQLVEDGLRILCNLDHRGARGAEEKTGDGAGMLLQKPHDFFHAEIPTLGDFDSYGVGQLFVPKDKWKQIALKKLIKGVCGAAACRLPGVRCRLMTPTLEGPLSNPSRRSGKCLLNHWTR